MTKRQIAFGVICFLGGILVGMEIAGNSEVLVRMVIIVAILLLCVYLALPYLPRGTQARRGPAQRTPQRRTGRSRKEEAPAEQVRLGTSHMTRHTRSSCLCLHRAEESIMEKNACAVRRNASKVGHAVRMRANGQEGYNYHANKRYTTSCQPPDAVSLVTLPA